MKQIDTDKTDWIIVAVILILLAFTTTGKCEDLDSYMKGKWDLIQQSPQYQGNRSFSMYMAKTYLLVAEDGSSTTYNITHYDSMHGVIAFTSKKRRYVGKVVEVKGYLFMTGVWWENGQDYAWWAIKTNEKKEKK